MIQKDINEVIRLELKLLKKNSKSWKLFAIFPLIIIILDIIL